jgi:hypothetical protein
MSKNDINLFGFDELKEKFEKMMDKWANTLSSALRVSGNAVVPKTRSLMDVDSLRRTSSGITSKHESSKKSLRFAKELFRVGGNYIIRWDERLLSSEIHQHCQ